jgi:hypothetical protein
MCLRLAVSPMRLDVGLAGPVRVIFPPSCWPAAREWRNVVWGQPKSKKKRNECERCTILYVLCAVLAVCVLVYPRRYATGRPVAQQKIGKIYKNKKIYIYIYIPQRCDDEWFASRGGPLLFSFFLLCNNTTTTKQQTKKTKKKKFCLIFFCCCVKFFGLRQKYISFIKELSQTWLCVCSRSYLLYIGPILFTFEFRCNIIQMTFRKCWKIFCRVSPKMCATFATPSTINFFFFFWLRCAVKVWQIVGYVRSAC